MSEYTLLVDEQKLLGSRPMEQNNVPQAVSDPELAANITRSASQQTFYTIHFLADRALRADAYRAYAYFRWLDDHIDQVTMTRPERIAFVNRQQMIVARAYCGERLGNLTAEEQFIIDLIENDEAADSGLRAYIDNMMAVMAFDARRQGQTISRQELDEYTLWLATAVTEALHHFIGHNCAAPQDETRYLAVIAAHITHMLRDTIEDAAAGYYNIPQEFLAVYDIKPTDVNHAAYQIWVQSRVKLARDYFQAGRDYMARVENCRCRIAGYAYIARFEIVLDAIEREFYRLRADYPERKNGRSALKMGWAALSQAF
jgi:phytoene/squalene synthetase